jgi:hypothetical protein
MPGSAVLNYHHFPMIIHLLKLIKIPCRRLLMSLASHSWRLVPKMPSMLSRLSWLWQRPSRTGTANIIMIECTSIILTLLEIRKVLLPYLCCSQDGQPASCSKCKATDSADPWAACQPEDILLLVLRVPDFFLRSMCKLDLM